MLQSVVNGYLSLKSYDAYTPARGEKLADTIAASVRAPQTASSYSVAELTTDTDSSQERILQYRSDMREALAPIVDLNAEREFALFGRFIATGNHEWLDKLSAAAKEYRVAEENMLKVRVPESAGLAHLRALNATGKYAETLERLVRFSNDPLATMALLRTYNDTEREFLLAFDALAKFYVHDVSNN